jgi:hypothetical protein
MLPLCQHMMPNGKRCQSSALNGTRFCDYHGRRIRPDASSIPFVFPQDLASVQHNLHVILMALQEGSISPSTAHSLIRVCRAASANLRAAARDKRKHRKCIDGEFRIRQTALPEHPI